MTAREVVVIGNGMFGSIAATLARSRGHNVTVVSNNEPMAASKASGCVLAPSWLGSLSAQQVKDGMDVLNQLYTVEDIVFTTNLLAKFKASRIDPDAMIVAPDVVSKVTKVNNGVVHLENGTVLKGQVLVAAGVWCAELVDVPGIRGLYGASVRFQAHLPSPRIHVYAPYRQSVGFQLNKKEVWFGDGTALIRTTWEKERTARMAKTLERGLQMLGVAGARHKVTEGVRPYVEGHKAGYFAKVGVNTWVSTGGAKNGTVLAAAQAARFVMEAKL
jgi:glycine/D-amino acid oxidase-like deaminating enzyme